MTEKQLYTELYKKKKDSVLEGIRESYPVLYWAKKYHVNNRGEEMDFTQMHYLVDLYKNIHLYKQMVVEKSVQCGLSELFIVSSHEEASRGLTVFYVLPKYEIRNRFVNNRVNRVHRKVGKYANLVRQATLEGGSHRTSLMHFGAGTIAYVGSNVEDEFIEIPVDSAYVDEKDRCNQRNLLMVPDRLTASPYKYWREISNPTIEDFGIDERYKESTRGLWMIKCDHCGKWFTPDFFKHVIQEIGPNRYGIRDPEYVKHLRGARLIHECGKSVDRLKKGEWIHEFPDRDWVGFRISKLFNKHSFTTQGTLSELAEDWIEKVNGHAAKEQVFINSNLGLPYTSAGAKIHAYQLDLCKRDYEYPQPPLHPKTPRFMGVDVGDLLHVVIRERTMDRGGPARRLLYADVVRNFKDLGKLIRDWQPKVVVIDAQPEIHEVSELKDAFNQVYSSRFVKDQLELAVNKQIRNVTMDRTSCLDYVKKAVEEQLLINPQRAEALCGGDYYSHMTALTRILDIDDDNPERNRYVWEGSKPDHFMLAEAYLLQGDGLIPEHSVFEFFQKELSRYKQEEKSTVKSLTDAVVENVGRSSAVAVVDQEAFLSKISRITPPAPTIRKDENVIEQERENVIKECLEAFGWVELTRFCRATGLNEEKGIKYLQDKGFMDDGVRYRDGKTFSGCYIKVPIKGKA
jgi:hypothetical protein